MFNFSKNNTENTEKNPQEIQKSLDKKIEAILFFKGEEISLEKLSSILSEKKKDVLEALEILKERLQNSALSILSDGEKIMLITKKEYSGLISELQSQENLGQLSGSALETLSIILYKGPISKAEIDQIRGVNSSYILRNLLIRGLVERKSEQGKNLYKETLELMRFLAIEKKQNLPGYEKVIEKLNEIDTTSED